jgi:hypothetical protein
LNIGKDAVLVVVVVSDDDDDDDVESVHRLPHSSTNENTRVEEIHRCDDDDDDGDNDDNDIDEKYSGVVGAWTGRLMSICWNAVMPFHPVLLLLLVMMFIPLARILFRHTVENPLETCIFHAKAIIIIIILQGQPAPPIMITERMDCGGGDESPVTLPLVWV